MKVLTELVANLPQAIDFVSTQPLEGLGATTEMLRRLCTDNPEASAALEKALTRSPGNPTGRNQYSEDNGIDNNVNNSADRDSPVGNSAAYALRKLRSDAPEAHARVLAVLGNVCRDRVT